MKKTTLLLATVLSALFANAQKVKETEVPAPVKTSFEKQYPGIKVEKWEKEGTNFEAEFDLKKVETSSLFDANGTMLETETEIKVSELPKGVTDYVTKNLGGKKIKEASKIVDASSVTTYEAEVDGADYIFDTNGNFIKKSN